MVASPNIVIPLLIVIDISETASTVMIFNLISVTSEAVSCSIYLIIFVLLGKIFRERLQNIMQSCGVCMPRSTPVPAAKNPGALAVKMGQTPSGTNKMMTKGTGETNKNLKVISDIDKGRSKPLTKSTVLDESDKTSSKNC